MHRPIQPKSLSWWREVGNSLIFQHSPSRGGSLRPQTWNRSERQLFYLIALTRIRTRDLWLWYHIELHAPTSSTQKPKLMGKGGQFTYTPTLWLPHCQLCPQLSCQPMANTLQHRRPPSELDWIDLLGGFVHSFKHQMVSLVYLNETIPTSWNCIKWPKNSFSHRHHLSMYPFISIHP